MYSMIEKQIALIPEEYMDEVVEFMDYILYKVKKKASEEERSTSDYFGSISKPLDGLSIQRSLRNEWD